MDYEFTKEKLKELDWPPCGQRPRKRRDGEMSESDDSLGQVVDPLGKDAADATKLFPGLAGNNETAARMSAATKQLPADETDIEDDDSVLPHPRKSWPRDIPKAPKSEESRHLYYAFDREKNDPPDEHVAERRYQAKLESSSSFVSHWRQPEHERSPNQKASILDEEKMNAFVAKAFKAWGWGTDAEFLTFIQNKKRTHDRELAAVKNPKARIAKALQQKEEIIQLRRERKQFRRGLEKEFKFGTSALVVGLKYNASQDKFFARIAYSKNSTRGSKVVEEEVLVPPWWINYNKYKSDVIQHVINMGQTDNGYVMVPPGMDIHVQNRAISQLKYVPASTTRKPIENESIQKGNSIVRGKQLRKRRAADDMIETPVPHHWLVKFSGETKGLRVNDDFLSAFDQDF